MLGVEDYGSDVESDNETTQQTPQPRLASSIASKLPPPIKKSTFSLPPPSASTSKRSSSGLSLPPPKKKAPKRIAIGLPALPTDEDEETQLDDRPPAKKPRLEAGAGSSGLLSMLPAPKNKAPVAPVQERVLGGGRGPGLVFKTAPSQPQHSQRVIVEDEEDEFSARLNEVPSGTSILEEVTEIQSTSISFLPPSLKKGRVNVSTEERHVRPQAPPKVSSAPAIDFFGLGESSSASSSNRPTPTSIPSPPTPSTSAPSTSKPHLIGISSAPKVEEFAPPEPTKEDLYPGYYMLPTGAWAAYDPQYYKSFYDKWKREYDAHVRALEKGIEKGFEAVEREGAREVNAAKEMERAKIEIQEREERKALTTAAGEAAAAPKMNIKGAALSGRARTRHQLSALLTEAYQNRETLEEQIAQGRRNRKEAGNKYGF
ncbi:unnamed protein product [Somion occarium]|uniref:Mitotic checkpoint regulator, MAD2B-interacting-domain-containing protein n=1 Tax=Somion occarium TaxID=3059160 RepID=A0ABP1D9N2_9APHY